MPPAPLQVKPVPLAPPNVEEFAFDFSGLPSPSSPSSPCWRSGLRAASNGASGVAVCAGAAASGRTAGAPLAQAMVCQRWVVELRGNLAALTENCGGLLERAGEVVGETDAPSEKEQSFRDLGLRHAKLMDAVQQILSANVAGVDRRARGAAARSPGHAEAVQDLSRSLFGELLRMDAESEPHSLRGEALRGDALRSDNLGDAASGLSRRDKSSTEADLLDSCVNGQGTVDAVATSSCGSPRKGLESTIEVSHPVDLIAPPQPAAMGPRAQPPTPLRFHDIQASPEQPRGSSTILSPAAAMDRIGQPKRSAEHMELVRTQASGVASSMSTSAGVLPDRQMQISHSQADSGDNIPSRRSTLGTLREVPSQTETSMSSVAAPTLHEPDIAPAPSVSSTAISDIWAKFHPSRCGGAPAWWDSSVATRHSCDRHPRMFESFRAQSASCLPTHQMIPPLLPPTQFVPSPLDCSGWSCGADTLDSSQRSW